MAFSSAMFGPNTGTSMAQRSAASAAGKKISQMGRGGDTMAIHASPFTKNLLRSLGGSGGTNPKTGLTEFQTNATSAVAGDATDALSAYNTLYDTRKSGGGVPDMARSEERRVGKECEGRCSSRWAQSH